MNVSGGHLSKEFFELVKAIGESRSKQEEDRIILAEVAALKQRLTEPQVSSVRMREYLVRSLYVEMLGHDAGFAYIHAVKLTQDKNLLCKRIGYLTCSLCLDDKNELLLLLINTIQKDLNSTNHLEVAAALGCISKLVSEEMIPAVFPSVMKLMATHSNELIRKKCCMVLHSFHRIDPNLIITEAKDAIRRALCDPDPSVMAAILSVIHDLAKEDRNAWCELVPSLVSILKQITEHRLPREYEYHRIPSPWVQIKLLSLLATLGEGDQQASEQMQEVLVEVLKRAELGANVGFAIIYECVKTITATYPSLRLLDLAATSISRFISSDNHNLKYVGITGLASIVRVHPTFAAQPAHQVVVLDCLEDVDETLKRRTLELLYRMTNPVNAAAVVEKLLLHLRISGDVDFRRDLVVKITRLADRFAPSHSWYVSVMNTIFELGGSLVSDDIARNLLRLIAEGPTGNEGEDRELRREFVDDYIRMLEKPTTLPDIMVKVAVWVIGEYGSLNSLDCYSSLESLLSLLCGCLERIFEDQTTRLWIVSAMLKISVLRLMAIVCPAETGPDLFEGEVLGHANGTSCPKWPPRKDRVTAGVAEALEKFSSSESPDLELRCREFERLIMSAEPGTEITNIHLLRELFPFDGACEDITVDPDLSFLDDFVSSALSSGSRPYQPPDKRRTTITTTDSIQDFDVAFIAPSQPVPVSSLKFTPYEAPKKPSPSALLQARPTVAQPDTAVFKVSGPRKWGPQGYSGLSNREEQRPTPAEPVQPAPQQTMYQPQQAYVPTPAPAPVPTGPRQLTERELAAQALFGGLTVPSVRTAASSDSGRRGGSVKSQPSGTAVGTVDLLDLGEMTNSTDQMRHQSNGAADSDLLGNIESLEDSLWAGSQTNNSVVLQPVEMTTTQVGTTWASLNAERRVSIPLNSSLSSIQSVFKKLQQGLNISIVAVIGVEGICAGLDVQSNSLIFFHARLNQQIVEMLLKSGNAQILEVIANQCLSLLS